jgi:APA family basic amino acid/polyamine antiporter
MLNLPAETWLRFAIWMVIGIVVYFLYGRSHSRLGRHEETALGETRNPRGGTAG